MSFGSGRLSEHDDDVTFVLSPRQPWKNGLGATGIDVCWRDCNKPPFTATVVAFSLFCVIFDSQLGFNKKSRVKSLGVESPGVDVPPGWVLSSCIKGSKRSTEFLDSPFTPKAELVSVPCSVFSVSSPRRSASLSGPSETGCASKTGCAWCVLETGCVLETRCASETGCVLETRCAPETGCVSAVVWTGGSMDVGWQMKRKLT